MASERMMQAIGAMERTVSRLEQQISALIDLAQAPEPEEPEPQESGPQVEAGLDLNEEKRAAARAALQSLDALITELKDRTDG
ncbi:MAG: hypothetical protein AB7E60_12140 [Sphingobium sp.]